MSPENLLKGAYYALEQCGLLLRGANILYRNRSYANTIVLAAFAHEELGRHRILLGLWRRARDGRETFKAAEIRKSGDKHDAKQKEGILGITIKSGIADLLAAMNKDPSSSEFQDAKAKLDKIVEARQKRTPNDRHAQRKKALYVEPISETQWNRPGDTSAIVAFEFLRDALNDYSLKCGNMQDAILASTNPELYAALQQWSDRPTLYPASELTRIMHQG
jgi:AbiV family abortive infection protein